MGRDLRNTLASLLPRRRHDLEVRDALTHSGEDAVHAVPAGEAYRAYAADDGYLPSFCEGNLQPKGRRNCPSWSKLGIACQAEGAVTRHRLDRHCCPLKESFGHRRGAVRSYGR